MAYETYQMVTGTVLSVEDRENDCCTKLVRIREKRQEIQLVVSGRTVVIQNIMLRPVYYTFTTMSLPPMTTPQKIIVMCRK